MQCRARANCEQTGHGYWYVGKADADAPGFRTDRCPRSWASSPFVSVVADMAFWTSKGAAANALGPDPVAAIFDAVGLWTWQREEARESKREKERNERERADRINASRGRGRGRGRQRVVIDHD